MEREKWVKSTVKFKIDKVAYAFEIVHNSLPSLGYSWEAIIDNWVPRTKEYTVESLCQYIMSKSEMSGGYAFTIEQYENMEK